MKIEIAESLLCSWLRHVKGCAITQLNWKVSSQWSFQDDKMSTMRSLGEAIQNEFRSDGWIIFKNDQDLSQAMRQVECDVVGIKMQASDSEVYAVESAFHESGLNYGSTEVTCAKVISKIVRVAMALNLYIPNCEHHIIFTSPKINKAILRYLPQALKRVDNIFKSYCCPCHFQLITNADFLNTVLHPVMAITQIVSDSNELFIRSIQLVKMFEGGSGQLSKSIEEDEIGCSIHFPTNDDHDELDDGDDSLNGMFGPKSTSIPQASHKSDSYGDLKIGKIASIHLRKWLEDKCDESWLNKFLNKDHSKRIFNINDSLLKTVRGQDARGHYRYSPTPVLIMGKKYYMYTQWFAADRTRLTNWLDAH